MVYIIVLDRQVLWISELKKAESETNSNNVTIIFVYLNVYSGEKLMEHIQRITGKKSKYKYINKQMLKYLCAS